jgi:hypothetical protein
MRGDPRAYRSQDAPCFSGALFGNRIETGRLVVGEIPRLGTCPAPNPLAAMLAVFGNAPDQGWWWPGSLVADDNRWPASRPVLRMTAHRRDRGANPAQTLDRGIGQRAPACGRRSISTLPAGPSAFHAQQVSRVTFAADHNNFLPATTP